MPVRELGEVIRLARSPERVVAGRTYQNFGIYSFGKGLFKKSSLDSISSRADLLYQVKTGQFIYSRLFAFEGSYGVVTPEFDGFYISNEYPTFDCDRDEIDPQYLGYYFKRQVVWRKVAEGSKGLGNRRQRVQPDQILSHSLNLPSVAEQQKTVAHIKELSSKVEEAQDLCLRVAIESATLFDAAMNDKWHEHSSWTRKPLGEVVEASSGQIDPRMEPYCDLPHINGESIESGTCKLLSYKSAKRDGVTSGKFHYLPGVVLYSKLRPYLRKATIVNFEGICSADMYALKVVSQEIDPKFLMYSLISKRFTNYANALSGRTRMPKLNQSQLFAYELAYPPLYRQIRIVAYLDGLLSQIMILRQHQAQAAAELDALLPSILDRAFTGPL